MNLQITALVKTDIVGYTPRTELLSPSELSSLLDQHKKLVSDVTHEFRGNMIKGEGDSFWISFPSATNGALAALEMHRRLQMSQAGRGDENRIAIRVVVSVGDVLHQDNDIFGSVVNLTARIEALTPADEIYLSQAAWLALNKADLFTSYVGTFNLKGFPEPERIYKVEKRHRTRIVSNQVIMFIDIRTWPQFMKSHSIEDVESVLFHLDTQVHKVCAEYEGTIRNIAGDLFILTFLEVDQAMQAGEKLCQEWRDMRYRYQVGVEIGVHKGDINILRSYIYSNDINIAALVMKINPFIYPDKESCSILVSGKIKDEIQGDSLRKRIQGIQYELIKHNFLLDVTEEQGVYELKFDDQISN